MDSLSVREYAELHGVSTSTVRRWINEFLIYAEQIGNRFYIPADEPPPPFNDEFQEPEPPVTDSFGSRDLPEETNFPPLVPRSDSEDTDEPDDEEEEEEEDCHDPEEFDPSTLRKPLGFATREEAEDYAGDIPVSTDIFRRCSDGFFMVRVTY